MEFKNLFMSKDKRDIVTKAREDERALCEREKTEALEELEERITSECNLRLISMSAEVNSMEFRLKDMKLREKKVRKDRETLRQQEVILRKVLSDVKFVADKAREDAVEEEQTIDRLVAELDGVGKKLLEDKSV